MDTEGTNLAGVVAELHTIGETIGAALIQQAELASQQEIVAATTQAVANTIKTDAKNRERKERRRFRTLVAVFAGGLLLVSVALGVGTAVYVTQKNAETAALQDRVDTNRDRTACVAALTFQFQRNQGLFDAAIGDWNTLFGQALAISSAQERVPGTPPTPELADAIRKLNEATTRLGNATQGLNNANTLLATAPTQCFGVKPNPTPVPG